MERRLPALFSGIAADHEPIEVETSGVARAVASADDGQADTAKAATHVVSRLFGAGFVAAMSTGDRVAFARWLYELYSAAPDLRAEAPGVDLDPFLAPRDAHWFAYLDDAEEFYQKGPAFKGRTITYAMANVLLDDLFAEARAGHRPVPRAHALQREGDRVQGLLRTGGQGQPLLRPGRAGALLPPRLTAAAGEQRR